jgi:RHS repeat-associated protein
VDSGGAIASTISYFPFGATRSSTGTSPTDMKFTGQRLDNTGLYYHNARYYDPGIGRFISADTIVPNPANPQCLNRYSYCLNNPLKYVDPSGHEGEEWESSPPPDYGDYLDDVKNGSNQTYTDWKNSQSGGENPSPNEIDKTVANVLAPAAVGTTELETGISAALSTLLKAAGLFGLIGSLLFIKGDCPNPNDHSLDVTKGDVTQGKGQAPDKGKPKSDYEQIDDKGNVKSRTRYDENGNKDYRDDYDHSHNGMQPHRHDWLIDPKTGYCIDKDSIGIP